MPTTTEKAIRYPTREELDAAWTRLVEKYGEGTLDDSANLMTVANGIAELRARLAAAESDRDRYREALRWATTETFTYRTIDGADYVPLDAWMRRIERLQAALEGDGDAS